MLPRGFQVLVRALRDWSCALALLLGWSSSCLAAASARDALLRYVPDDTAFCLIVQDLRGSWAALLQSPFVDHLRESASWKALAGGVPKQHLQQLDKSLTRHFGLDWNQFRDEILGDALVFAVRPGPADKPDQDMGLFLLRAQNAQTLVQAIDHFNETQKKAGQLLRLETVDYKGASYIRRVDQKETIFYHVNGPILLFTSQEQYLKQALDQAQATPAEGTTPLAAKLRLLGAERSLLAIWINPRPLDGRMDFRTREAPENQATSRRAFSTIWRSLDGIVLAFNLDREMSLSLAVQARLKDMPPGVQRFLTAAAQPNELLRYLPEEPLLALTGRLPVGALVDAVGEFLPPGVRRTLLTDLDRLVGAHMGGKRVEQDILPFLGPEVGLFAIAPPSAEKSLIPSTVLAVRVSAGNEAAPVDQALLEGMGLGAHFLVLFNNLQNSDRPITLKRIVLDQREIKYLAGDKAFPPGLQPAFTLHGGLLILASSPEAIRRFVPGPGAPPGETQTLLRISFKAWRNFLSERRDALIESMRTNNDLTAQQAGQRLDLLLEMLGHFDRLDLQHKSSRNQFTLTLSLRPSRAFKK